MALLVSAAQAKRKSNTSIAGNLDSILKPLIKKIDAATAKGKFYIENAFGGKEISEIKLKATIDLLEKAGYKVEAVEVIDETNENDEGHDEYKVSWEDVEPATEDEIDTADLSAVEADELASTDEETQTTQEEDQSDSSLASEDAEDDEEIDVVVAAATPAVKSKSKK